jgi:hypothetical protein
MTTVFFNSQSKIYINHLTKGTMVNVAFIRTALHRFVKALKKK